MLLLIAASTCPNEFSHLGWGWTSCCHGFGFSRPAPLPSWRRLLRRNDNVRVHIAEAAEAEVHVGVSPSAWAADEDLTKINDSGVNRSNNIESGEQQEQLQKLQQPQQQRQPPQTQKESSTPSRSSCADGLPLLPIDEASLRRASQDTLLPSSPPLTFEKYLTMTTKRVPVEIRFQSGTIGQQLRPFVLTVAKKVKARYPDVVVQRTDLGDAPPGDPSLPAFEVLVDGRAVVGKAEMVDLTGGGGFSVYVSMGEIDQAITKARRKRRPSTTYSQQGEEAGNGEKGVSAIRLEVLRARQQQQQRRNSADNHWD
jgi:hypothetical protein